MKAPIAVPTAVASPMHLPAALAAPTRVPSAPAQPTRGPAPPTTGSYTNSTAEQNPSDNPLNGVLPAALALARTLETETDRALAIAGLTARGFLALREIRSGRAPTQRDLARRLHLEPSTTCELLARLARRRLVARGPGRLVSGRVTRRTSRRGRGERDGPRARGASPTLTPAGAAALERAEKVVARLEREWARRMRAARGSAGDGWLGPIYGLRRWIAEGLASIAAPASPRQHRRASIAAPASPRPHRHARIAAPGSPRPPRPPGPPRTPRPVRPAGSRAAP